MIEISHVAVLHRHIVGVDTDTSAGYIVIAVKKVSCTVQGHVVGNDIQADACASRAKVLGQIGICCDVLSASKKVFPDAVISEACHVEYIGICVGYLCADRAIAGDAVAIREPVAEAQCISAEESQIGADIKAWLT